MNIQSQTGHKKQCVAEQGIGLTHVPMKKGSSNDESVAQGKHRTEPRPEYVEVQSKKWGQVKAASAPNRRQRDSHEDRNHSCQQRGQHRDRVGESFQKHSTSVEAQCQPRQDEIESFELWREYGYFSLESIRKGSRPRILRVP